MQFILLWASQILIASAVVLSLLLWRRQRDARVLLLTGFLAVVAARFAIFVVEVLQGVDLTTAAVWVQLSIAAFGVAAVIGLDRLLTGESRRRRAMDRIQGALQEIGAGADATGSEFFQLAVDRLSEVLDVEFAFVGELDEGTTPCIRLRALSERGRDAETATYELAGSPCERVVGGEPFCLGRDARETFPESALLGELGVEAYAAVPLFAADGRPIGLVGAMDREPIEDPEQLLPALSIIAARTQVELLRERHDEMLRRSEQRYRVLFEESQDALYISHPDGRMIDANPAAVRLFGYDSKEQLLEEFDALDHYLHPEDRDTLVALLKRDGRVKDYPIDVRRRNGEVLDILSSTTLERDADGKIVALRGTLRDVTHERELQRQLLRSQRMEAVGRMAGGVAHDFNNLLTVINGHSDLMLGELEEGSPLTEDVAEIKAAVQRAAAFTRRLLLLSRRKLLAPKAIDLNAVIGDLFGLLQRAVSDDVVLELDLDAAATGVVADAAEMEQVLLNLVINARDAMPSGGTVRIATRTLEEGSPEVAARGLSGGPWVELSVADDGLGIEPEVRDRIFEPFFTTKDATIGTGLGLSTVYGIVQQLKGDIAVDSTPGEGARFSILIPSVEAEAGLDEEEGDDVDPRGEETLLVVDDEPAVRRLCRSYLESQGYRVLVAGSGREALNLLGEAPIDLLISDVMMPGMRGDELVDVARQSSSGLRVLLISGHVGSSEDLDGVGEVSLLTKPFTTGELGRRVREILDG